jgi:pyruvate ferredoxin oxidoreductase alpha subunit
MTASVQLPGRVMEASEGIAEAVRVAGPQVVAAYPITPQTHIVEALAKAVADGRLAAEFLTVESEHSAASAVLGASAAGVRTFTATSSQGLLYMSEVVFDLAGMRLPVVMTVANRAISGPLSIWNDHQDSMALRDAGWIQVFAQTPQEAHDLHLVAYRVAEDQRVLLPVMVCVDGFVLTHAFEAVELVTEDQASAFLPPYRPTAILDPANPVTFGTYAEPALYEEARFAVEEAQRAGAPVLEEALAEFGTITGRYYDAALDRYRVEDAAVVLVAMGTAAQTARDVVDELRDDGFAAGLVAIRTFRPFPREALRAALAGADRVVVLDRAVSLGAGGIVAAEVRDALYGLPGAPAVVGAVAGLGGRDVSRETLGQAFMATEDGWVDLRQSPAQRRTA